MIPHERRWNKTALMKAIQSAGFKQTGIKDECIVLTLPADDEFRKLAHEVT